MEAIRIQNKLKMLFSQILKPDYVMNTYYTDGIINKIVRFTDPEICVIGNMPLISDLIIESFNHIDNVHYTVKVFVIRTLSTISCRELHFSKIYGKQGDKILKGFKEINAESANASLTVAYMNVALAVAKHNSGITWLLETGVWKEILSMCTEKCTIFVKRQAYKFAAQFLWRLNDIGDLPNIKVVLSVLLAPLTEIDFLTVENVSSEEEEKLAQTLDPTLHILLALLDNPKIEKETILMDYLVKVYQINTHLYVILDGIHKDDTVLLLGKLVYWFGFAKRFLTKPPGPTVVFTMEDFLDLNATYFNVIQFLIQRRNPTLTLAFCNHSLLVFRKICKDKDKVIWNIEDKHYVISNQMLFMCLVPLLVFVKLDKNETGSGPDKQFDEFIERLLYSTCEHTAKAAYSLKALIEELDAMPIIVQSVKKLSCLKGQLDEEQANCLFQVLFYVLREYDPIDEYGVAKQEGRYQQYENNQNKLLVMTYVMDMVLCLLKNYNINWRESVEVICLYSLVYSILQRPNLTTKYVVASLNVIAMTIRKFLPPNLTLLLESQPGSPMDDLGRLIFNKIHDLSWEVRDSALELLFVCTEISFVKFPSFQKQLLEHNLINVASAIAFHDFESYVQVSALKCVGAASKITALWEQLTMKNPDIQDHILFILCNNQEGIVRKEACSVLTDLYQNLKLSPAFKNNLYEHMVSAALSDFHWEVQIAALKFWRVVFQSFLTDQGMLDGTFPPITFSKESRKIVTLNEAEIQRRLIKILDELGSIGLLTILIKLLHDDTDVEVLSAALNLSQEIFDMISKYKVPERLKPKTDERVEDILTFIKEEVDDDAMVADTSEVKTPDTVIEGILNASDVNLLASIYERHMTLQSTKKEGICTPKIKLSKSASPYAYVEFIRNKDFKAVIDEKRKWNDGIRSLSSLLDDVLGIYDENKESNSLDCY